jgi:hypothetical protein
MTTVSSSPQSNASAAPGIESEPLRCADASEPILSTRHPFVAYKETNPASGAWRVRIKSRHETTAVLYPNAIRLQARAVSAEGKSAFTWSNSADAGPRGAKNLQFLVHVNGGEPAAIEVFPGSVSANSGPAQVPVKFCWPAA